MHIRFIVYPGSYTYILKLIGLIKGRTHSICERKGCLEATKLLQIVTFIDKQRNSEREIERDIMHPFDNIERKAGGEGSIKLLMKLVNDSPLRAASVA